MSEILAVNARSLFDQGVHIILTDPKTRRGMGRCSEHNPIKDEETLDLMCEEHPDASLEVVVGEDAGLTALGVGLGDYGENGESSFKSLCEKYGVPETLAYSVPADARDYFGSPPVDFVQYHLFKFDTDASKFEERSGLKWLTDVQGILAYPSIWDGKQVKQIGTGTSVQSLTVWLQGGTNTNEIEQVAGAEGAVDTEAEELATPPEDDPQTGEVISRVQIIPLAYEAMGKEETGIRSHLEELRQEVKSSAAGGDKAEVLSKALEWNRANGEELKTAEVIGIVEEIMQSNVEQAPVLAPRELLFKLAEDMTLFNDDQNKAYFFYEGEAFSAPSDQVKNRLIHHYLKEMEDLPPTKELNAVLRILESRARFDGPRINLFNRVAKSEGAIYYDLRDKRYVRVTSDGWDIAPSFPLFRRYQHLQPQAEPVSGGDPWKVFDYLTVPEESRLLVMVYIISLFVPKIAHPVLAVCGDQGSSKSFFCTVINRLVDPTLTERVIQPKNERDLIQTLRQKYVTVLDNLSKIDNRVSDIFCQVCTGGSISYRELYTNEGENIAQFRHVVILNSINLAIVNADLMDRSIIMKLRRIDPQDRKPEHELWEAFEAARPGILGGIFDAVSKAMEVYPSVVVEHLPRLADFAKWGYAIAEALGMSGDQFLEDFSQNVKRQNESVVEKNVLCQAVMTLMAEGKPYLAKVSDAHETLKSIVKKDAKDETFPKLPHLLRPSMDRLRASLLEHGIVYEFMERTSAGVRILITKTGSQDSLSKSDSDTATTPAGKDEADEADEALSELPEVELDEIPEAINE